jgi:repressor LexA
MVNIMVTPTQHKIYHFIKQYLDKHDYAPSLQEIAHGIGIKSRSLISRYVHALEKTGLLELADEGHRKIRLISSNDDMALPLVGKIAAGLPIEAVTQHDHLVLKDLLVGEGRYALLVKGDSMINEGILDGDIVICEKREQAQEGEIVVALIDNQEATLKRIHFTDDGKITLIPANSSYTAQIYAAQRVNIQGVFVGLLRLPPRLPKRAKLRQ